jgi:transcriptional regulator GlxA family with amidase domain
VIGSLASIRPDFQPVVVAERPGPVETDLRIQMVPDRTFGEEPRPYALVVPGGDTPTLRAMNNPAIRRYVRAAAEGAEYVCSVCTGALILASVGLTQGRQSPTHWAFARVLESYGVHYVRRRWIEDGKFIFSQGVSSGIDAALALVARMTDEATARQVQLSLEYDPQPPLGGIDYAQQDSLVPLPVRLVIGTMSLAAPLLTAGPRRMTRKAGWKPLDGPTNRLPSPRNDEH